MLRHSTCIFRRNRFSTIQQRSSSSKSELIHLNGIHPELKYGSGTDRHGTILNTPKWDETNNLYKETINTAIKSKKPKVLETPFENFKKEIEMYQQLNRNNKSYMKIVNNNQYSQDN